jgi:hypothetical protein
MPTVGPIFHVSPFPNCLLLLSFGRFKGSYPAIHCIHVVRPMTHLFYMRYKIPIRITKDGHSHSLLARTLQKTRRASLPYLPAASPAMAAAPNPTMRRKNPRPWLMTPSGSVWPDAAVPRCCHINTRCAHSAPATTTAAPRPPQHAQAIAQPTHPCHQTRTTPSRPRVTRPGSWVFCSRHRPIPRPHCASR